MLRLGGPGSRPRVLGADLGDTDPAPLLPNISEYDFGRREGHAFGQQAFIELTERAVDNAGRRRRTLKQVLQIVIVVAVESADEHRFLGAHQLSVLEAVIGAAARLQGQPAVGPELTFAAEAVRRLYPPDQ